MPTRLEVVRPSDAPLLAALKIQTFIDTYGSDNEPEHVDDHLAREFSPEAITRTLEHPESTTWWCVDDGTPVGFLKLNRGSAQTVTGHDDGLEIEQIYVRTACHGRGFGRLLLDHATETARKDRSPFVWLGVWEHNRNAKAVYEHVGFVQTGEHTFLFGNVKQRDLIMRLYV